MTISKELNGQTLTVKLDGRLDTSTSPKLQNELSESLTGVKELVFDFEGLEYISSSGLRILLSAQKQMSNNGSMVLKNVSETVMEIFEITGFDDILTIE